MHENWHEKQKNIALVWKFIKFDALKQKKSAESQQSVRKK